MFKLKQTDLQEVIQGEVTDRVGVQLPVPGILGQGNSYKGRQLLKFNQNLDSALLPMNSIAFDYEREREGGRVGGLMRTSE